MLVAITNIALSAEPPRQRLPAPAANRPAEPVVRKERVEPNQNAERSARSFQAAQSSRSRLTYDQELSRVFVEIVDPESGEVVQRFPPEELVKHIDSIVAAANGEVDDSGLVLDRVV